MPQIYVSIAQKGKTESTATARTHNVTIDRSEAKGGTDNGAMGGEVFLMGLAGCFMSNLLAAINARELDITNVAADLTAETVEKPLRFSEIDIAVTANYLDKKEMEKLIVIAERACLVANTLKDAVKLTVRLVN
ncbi:MAG: osmotically inducible protein OsmC [Denitrovibrio sp.]|nr:MAG: osmotically inducible protein OsmC [Denitrovibrio sp.]